MNGIDIPLNVAIVGIVGILALFNTIVLVLTKNKNQKPNRFLAGFFLSLSIGYLLQIPYYGGYLKSINWQILAFPFSFLATALLYSFVQSSLLRDFSIRSSHLLFAPFFIAGVIAIFSLMGFLPLGSEKIVTGFGGFLMIEAFIVWLTILNLRTILNYKTYLTQNSSEEHIERYGWIRFIVFACLVYSLFPLLFGLFAHATDIPIKGQLSYVVGGIVTVCYLMLVLLKTIQFGPKSQPISKEQLSFVNKSAFVAEPTPEQKDLFSSIETLLSSSKMFTRPDLNLNLLASALNKSAREISSCINLCSKRNFYEYINDHRIEETKKILSSNPDSKLTISEVMYKVGYNSKSSFNTAFKSRVNQTPFKFRKEKLKIIGSNP